MDNNTELVFRVTQESDGGYSAACLTESIFTQGDTWEELEVMIRDAADCYFFDDPRPRSIRIELQK
jgi:predicted RNase H-like HicB family nuclease